MSRKNSGGGGGIGDESKLSPTSSLSPYLLPLIGVRAGGARGAAAPPNFGQLRFFGQQEKIWAKPGFKDVSFFLMLF